MKGIFKIVVGVAVLASTVLSSGETKAEIRYIDTPYGKVAVSEDTTQYTQLKPSTEPGYKYTITGGKTSPEAVRKGTVWVPSPTNSGYRRSSGRCQSYYSIAADGSRCGRRAAPYR